MIIRRRGGVETWNKISPRPHLDLWPVVNLKIFVDEAGLGAWSTDLNEMFSTGASSHKFGALIRYQFRHIHIFCHGSMGGLNFKLGSAWLV